MKRIFSEDLHVYVTQDGEGHELTVLCKSPDLWVRLENMYLPNAGRAIEDTISSPHAQHYYSFLADYDTTWRVFRWEGRGFHWKGKLSYDLMEELERALHCEVTIQDLRSWTVQETAEKGAALLAGLMGLLADRDAIIYWENWIRKERSSADITEWLEEFYLYSTKEARHYLSPVFNYYVPHRHDGSYAAMGYFKRHLRATMKVLLEDKRHVARLEVTQRMARLMYRSVGIAQTEEFVGEAISAIREYLGEFNIPVEVGYVASGLEMWSLYKFKGAEL